MKVIPHEIRRQDRTNDRDADPVPGQSQGEVTGDAASPSDYPGIEGFTKKEHVQAAISSCGSPDQLDAHSGPGFRVGRPELLQLGHQPWVFREMGPTFQKCSKVGAHGGFQ